MDMTSRCRARAAFMAGVVSLLAACGGGGAGGGGGDDPGGGDTGQTGAIYFPTTAGAVWRYQSPTAGALVSRVAGTRTVNGRTVTVVEDTDSGATTESLYDRTAAGVLQLPSAQADAVERALSTVPVLPLPLVAGRTSVPLDQDGITIADVDGDGRTDAVQLRADQEVVGFGAVSTKAGAFQQAAHVRTVLTQTVRLSSGRAPVTVTVTLDAWFAPDIGLVKARSVTAGPGVSDSEDLQITAYSVGDLRSERVAPTISARVPAVSSVGTGAAVQVTFSEAMDAHGDVQALLTVTDSGGTALPGTVSWVDERTLSFAPSGVPASGTYTVTLAASLQDLATNLLSGAREWTFAVDRDPPAVAAVVPADGSVDVPVDVQVQIDFGEAPLPETVNSSSVQLVSPQGVVPATLSVSGTRVTLAPTTPLARAFDYSIRVFGVTDALGNAMGPGVLSRFRTDNGRLGLPVALSGLDSVSEAKAADLDGDGRTDLLVLGWVSQPGPVGLYDVRQQPDGSLAAPEALAVSVGPGCDLAGGLPTDVDGDGRTDIVVATGCNIQVLLRQADGSLRRAATLALTTAASQLERIRTPGLPSLATLPLDSSGPTGMSKLRVWRQTSAGVFSSPTDLVPALRSLYNLHVADVNGDGLDDLLFWGLLSASDEYGVEILLQKQDGSFMAGTQWAAPHCGGEYSVAVGDVNGDGRADLVLIASGCGMDAQIAVRLQLPTGSFGPVSLLNSATNLSRLALADMDGDGRIDVVALHDTYGVGLYLQQADGSLGAETLYSGGGRLAQLVVADLTGDGRLDVFTSAGLMRQKVTSPGATAVRGPLRRPLRGLPRGAH